MRRRRILHIQLCPLMSGVQRVSLAILEALDPNEWEIFVMCRPGGPFVDEILHRGWRYLPANFLRRQFSPLDVFAFFEVFRACRRHRFDIVHTHSSKTGFIGRIAARLAGVPKIVHSVHGFPFHRGQFLPLQWAYMGLERFAARLSDRVVFVNRSEREYAVRAGIVRAERALTIYNGLETVESARRHSGEGLVTVGWSGRFTAQKNPVATVEAACRAASKNSMLRFVFLGDGELWEACQRMVSSYGLGDRILLPGWRSDVRDWMSRFDVFLLFSRWEGLPLSILEAMAAGLPVIVSAITGNEELVDERNGWRIAVRDIAGLERVLLSLPDHRGEIAEKGGASLRRIREEFGRERFIRQHLELYEE
jgi:glycosyltransferase involved in cell wall biosynthesis